MSTTEALLIQFCSAQNLPDLSPLANPLLEEFEVCGILWDLMQAKLSLEKQREFLRDVCSHSGIPTLGMLLSLIKADVDEEQCNSSFGIIRMVPDFAPTLSGRIRGFFQTNLPGAVVLMDRQNIEDVVYSIGGIVSDSDECILCALDELKFQTNPDRFTRDLERETKNWDDCYAARMKILGSDIANLTALKLSLECQLVDSPVTTPKTPGGGFAGGAALSFAPAPTVGEKRRIGPNGYTFLRKK
jgi:hypothetical protein